GILLLIHLPHGIIGSIPYDEGEKRIITPVEQKAVLRRIEMVDARCRKNGIPANVARRVLPRLALPGDPGKNVNGWEFLRGSDAPRDPETRSDDELRRLLEN